MGCRPIALARFWGQIPEETCRMPLDPLLFPSAAAEHHERPDG
jgi:hypothetical protein